MIKWQILFSLCSSYLPHFLPYTFPLLFVTQSAGKSFNLKRCYRHPVRSSLSQSLSVVFHHNRINFMYLSIFCPVVCFFCSLHLYHRELNPPTNIISVCVYKRGTFMCDTKTPLAKLRMPTFMWLLVLSGILEGLLTKVIRIYKIKLIRNDKVVQLSNWSIIHNHS